MKLPLVKLRKLVTVVPRRKFVLSGTVRENIDLLGKAQGDWQLWAALEQCHFADVVRRWPARLDERVCGEEVQVGSRMRKLSRYEQEMVCLVRAMFAADVQESSIMCIDNVEEISDEQTRNLILRRHLMFGMTVIVSCTRSSLIPSDVENLHALLLDDEEPIESETASDDVGSASEEGSDYLSASESDFTAAGTKLRSDELPAAAGAKKHRKGTGRMIWSGIKSGIKGGVKTVRKASYLSMQLYEGKSKGGVE
uniref:ABC transporter domain-containing protein n=1 Tax=Guillardia theta TaxID=55529 RepID=A0A7S4LZD2_GUITH